MERFICENIFVPLRYGPSHKTEMLSQVLFGEKYTVIERSGSWIKTETDFDKYLGWVDTAHLAHSPDVDGLKGFVLNRSLVCYKNDTTRLVLEAGCEIYQPDFVNKSFFIAQNKYSTGDEFSPQHISINNSLQDTALRFINSPYIWGGRIPSGIDCSGLTQLIYKIHGITLPRDSWKQAETGENIDFLDAARPGDLVFFNNERGEISHVGMMIAEGLVIHASGRVRVDTIDHQGIFKHEIESYSHQLRMIRRILI